MPGSVSSMPPTPPICALVSSVGGLIVSLMLSGVGFVNNAWVVYERPNYEDEFQRGIRGHDCYKKEHVKCLPWDFANKSTKFPAPFNKVLEASFVVHIAFYITIIIMISQVCWIVYTFGNCCSLKFSNRVEKFRLFLFHIIIIPVFLWIILYLLIIYETSTDNIFPKPLVPTENKYSIGLGFWLFFLGGLIPYTMAVYFLFDDKIIETKTKMTEVFFHRRRVPNEEEELEPQ